MGVRGSELTSVTGFGRHLDEFPSGTVTGIERYEVLVKRPRGCRVVVGVS